MKKTNIAKRIVSIVLAMSIVLSFALVSVSAVPADYTVVDNKIDIQGFEENYNMVAAWASGKVGSIELSGEQVHGGNSSLKITSAASDRILQLRITPVNAAFEANSKYHMSFWLYQGTSGVGNLSQLATQTLADHGIAAKQYVHKSSLNGWNKVCINIETGATPNKAFFLGAYSNNAGDTIYIDDLEIAKVSSFDGKNNVVPAGASVTSAAYANFENSSYAFTSDKASGVTRGVSTVYAHGGNVSFTLSGSDAVNNTAEAACYFIPTLLNTNIVGSEDTKIKAGKYYVSYYVYSPDKEVTSILWTSRAKVIEQKVPQGVWTKLSATFEYTDGMANAANSRLMDLSIIGLQNTKVYFDDFVVAEISEISTEPVVITAGNFDYDYDNNTATVPFTSNIGLKSVKAADVTVTPDSANVESVTVTDDNNLVVAFSGLAPETTYSLSFNGKNAFGGTVEGGQGTFTTPLAALAPWEISTTSIRNNETGVVAPVDAVYFTTPYPVDEATLTTDKFSITGYDASVTGVELVSATKVKVSLAGIYPAETYTLSVTGVKNTSGGVMRDKSLTFTTRDGDYGFDINFDNLATNEETGKLIMPSQLAQVGTIMTLALDETTFYSSTHSASIAMQDVSYDKIAKVSINHLNTNKTYKISFCISSGWTLAGQRAGQNVIDGEDGFAVVKKPTAEATEKAGWTKVTTVVTTGTVGGVTLNLWGVTTDKVYIDDISVQEVNSTICNPIMTKAGAYVYDLTAGDTTIEVPVIGGASNVKAFAVQYGENNKMLTATAGTVNAAGNIEFALTNAQAVKTKIIIMDATTYAPLCAYIQYN